MRDDDTQPTMTREQAIIYAHGRGAYSDEECDKAGLPRRSPCCCAVCLPVRTSNADYSEPVRLREGCNCPWKCSNPECVAEIAAEIASAVNAATQEQSP